MPSNPELQDMVADILTGFNNGVTQLADMLTAVQQKLGYVPPSTVALIAEKTGVSRPEIYRAIELSPSLSLKPTGEHTLYICNAENCCMQGGIQLMEFAKQRLGIHEFETTPDQKIRLESFRCLGNCSMAPNVMLDGRVYGMMDNQQLEKLLGKITSP